MTSARLRLATEEHHRAMALADWALSKRATMPTYARSQFWLAMEHERRAAELVGNSEPSRSVLYRSAASLAVDAEQYDEARRLVACGLAGKPPAEIAAELREVLTRCPPPPPTTPSPTPTEPAPRPRRGSRRA